MEAKLKRWHLDLLLLVKILKTKPKCPYLMEVVCSFHSGDISFIAPAIPLNRNCNLNLTFQPRLQFYCRIYLITFVEHRWWSRRMDGWKGEAAWTLPFSGWWGIRRPSHISLLRFIPLFLHHDRGSAACVSMNAKISHFTDAERTRCLSW